MKRSTISTRRSAPSASRPRSKSKHYLQASRSRSHERDADNMIYDEEYDDFRPAQSLKRSARSQGGQTLKDDIVRLVLADHTPLKRLISVLKDSTLTMRTRRRAFDQFAPILLVHIHAEQESLYAFLKDESSELRFHGLEGEVEHSLVDYMIEEMKMAEDTSIWSARAKVLAELVEHHLHIEEMETIPLFKQEVDIEDRVLIGKQYLDLKDHFRRDESLTADEVEAIEEERIRDYRSSNLMQ